MPPTIAFLCGAPNPPSRARFAEAAESAGAAMLWLDSLAVEEEGCELRYDGAALALPDVVVPRSGGLTSDLALEALEAFEAREVPFVNAPRSIRVARDKLSAAEVLLASGIPVPPTAPVPASPATAAELAQLAGLLGGFPVVAKERRSMRGQGVALCRTAEEFASATAAMVTGALVQRFVGDGSGTDVRALVVGGRVLGAIRRTPAPGQFRANAHHGAAVERVAIDGPLAAIALKAADALRLDVAGVDLIEHEGEWLVVEVNASPGFDAFERATGTDVAGEIVALALVRAGR